MGGENEEEVKYERCGGEEVRKSRSGKRRDCPASSRSVIKDGRGGESKQEEKSKKYELCKRYDMTKWDIKKEQKKPDRPIFSFRSQETRYE